MSQDWTPLVLRAAPGSKTAKAPTSQKAKDLSAIQGGNVEKKKTYGNVNANKIEAQVEAGTFEIQTVGTDFRLALLKARQAKGLSQKELAEKINVKVAIITEYEQGKGTPDGAVISKLNRVLGVTLPKPPKKKAPKVDDL